MIIRSSMLYSFKSCPAKFNYRYIKGLRSRQAYKNVDTYFGTMLHLSLELYHQEGYNQAMTVWEDYDQTLANDKKNPNTGRVLVDKYIQSPLNPICLEKNFTFKIGNHDWQGRFDMIAEYNGVKMVVDHKTTSYGFDQLKPNDQFMSYFLGAKIYYKDVEGLIVQVFNVSNMTIERKITSFSVEEVKEWQDETKLLLAYMTRCKNAECFPKSKNCTFFGKDCVFKVLCTSPPSTRERWASSLFNRIEKPTEY